ncbi:TM2 domain-containing protein [Candidatus Heimdallarchaeota archaeon]|nr:MAG: TM2 domain-containing protein [Candidatus Heimdallarchaeota archaeon]
MILVTFFLGIPGIHRFLKKYWLSAIVYLCTGGLFGIGWIIDLIFIILDKPLFWQS